MLESFVFFLCGGFLLLAAVMTVASRNAVAAACWLIFGFLNVAGIFALLSAAFLAVLQVLVYAGAIMVLFLFVIMMLHGPVLGAELGPRSPWVWPAVGLPVVAWAAALVGWLRGAPAGGFSGPVPADFGHTEPVAALLLDRYLLAFELISIILLIAIIGAVALGRRERSLPW